MSESGASEQLEVTVWDDDQVIADSPPADRAVALWAAAARQLLGHDAIATVAIDCDDAETELRLRAAGFQTAEVEPDDGADTPEETVVVQREGRLAELLDAVLRLPPEAPLGALATGSGKGADLDLGAGLDVWGAGAAEALRAAAAELGLALSERPPDE